MTYDTLRERQVDQFLDAPAFPDVEGRNVYISGPIDGDADAARKFALVHRACIDGGARTVFNPMAGAVQVRRPNWTREQHMLADVSTLTNGTTDMVLLMPGWTGSEGASLEHKVATACGIEAVDVDVPAPGDGPRMITNGRW